MTAARLLFVCSQNVCRSPYLAIATSMRLERQLAAGLVLSSRGMNARPDHGMCEVAISALGDGGEILGRSHRSRRVMSDDVQWADLILTASTTERAGVATLDPRTRSRLFTVREALLLAGVESFDAPADDRGDPGEHLRRFAGVLHGRRGTMRTVSPGTRGTRFGRRRHSGSSLDIVDRHVEGAASHARLFRELDADLEALQDLLGTALGNTSGDEAFR